ncbi:MAG TPA: FGGY family carbohydrate kinase [Opitutales bacterium]|jgi:xylulokinase|nr:FGGY family carbohydrate kinase [Opitutales bacterium]
MSLLLGLDVGSSSVIAGLLHGPQVLAQSPREFFPTRFTGPRAELDPEVLLAAIRRAIAHLGPRAKEIDAIALAVMAATWVAMDKNGNPLTPIVTHQDRRSVVEAHDLETRMRAKRHLMLCGSRPFPGGISSTSWAWYLRHQRASLKRANLVGPISTFIIRQFTGARVVDPSNASFTGLYHTLNLSGWSPELCANLGVSASLLPEVLESDRVAGHVTPEAARRFGLRNGTPTLAGIVDGSTGMLLAGAKTGQLFNVVGSTDVLALCTEKPRPHPQLLTRALGVKGKWLQVNTLAAVASAIYWARAQLFPEISIKNFPALLHRLSKQGAAAAGTVQFAPYLAGERMNIDQKQGAFTGLTLATTREQMLAAIIESLAQASAARLPLLEGTGTKLLRTVAVSGGADRIDELMRRDWPGRWRYRSVTEATLRGLGTLTPRER